jgi:ABC-type transport system involved in cytochrome c biogenesis permease subunit
VLGGVGALYQKTPRGSGWPLEKLFSFQSAHQWLLFLSAVGLCVGFIASLMYLLQSQQLRAKTPPSRAWKLLSLERLEAMNRRAIFLAFPLLTLGMLLGLILMTRAHPRGWTDPRVVASAVLWLTFAVVLYLRLARQARGRRVAVLTIVTFGLLLFCLVLAHPIGTGGGR